MTPVIVWIYSFISPQSNIGFYSYTSKSFTGTIRYGMTGMPFRGGRGPGMVQITKRANTSDALCIYMCNCT